MEKAVVGKTDVLTKIMMAVLAGGHVLIEDMPGTGKTTMALAPFPKPCSWRRSGCSLPRMCFRRISPDLPCTRRRPGSLPISRERLCVTCFWRMRSTGRLRRPSIRPARGNGGTAGYGGRRHKADRQAVHCDRYGEPGGIGGNPAPPRSPSWTGL